MADSGLRVGELEAQYPLYCKAVRILVRDGVSLSKARRTVCWQKLELLPAACRATTGSRNTCICPSSVINAMAS